MKTSRVEIANEPKHLCNIPHQPIQGGKLNLNQHCSFWGVWYVQTEMSFVEGDVHLKGIFIFWNNAGL